MHKNEAGGALAWPLGFVAVMVAVTATYFVLPHVAVTMVCSTLVVLVPATAVLVGVTLHRPAHRLPWLLLAAGQFAFVLGNLALFSYEHLLLREPPLPSLADIGFVAMYPLFTAGLVTLVRARSTARDLASLLDALVVTVGMGMLSWVFLIDPHVDAATLDLPARLTSITYPLGDILLLAVLARLFFDRGPRGTAFYLLGSSFVLTLLSDTLFSLARINGTWQTGTAIDAGFILASLCLGAAALHPSMTSLAWTARRPLPSGTSVTAFRFVLLLIPASLAVPLLDAVASLAGREVDKVISVGGAVTLCAIATLRMSGLVRALRRTMRQNEQWARQETLLREAAAALVAARSHDRIGTAAVESALALAGGRESVACLREGDDLDVLDPDLLAALDGGPVALRGPAAVAACRGCGMPARPAVLLLPLFAHGELCGVLAVADRRPVPSVVTQALQTLAAQVALAMESATLTENLHRKQHEERFRRLVQNSSDVITVVDRDLVVRYQTASVAQVFGYGPEDLVGSSLLELVHLDDSALFRAAMAPSGRAAEATLECRIRCADGTYLLAETVATPVDDEPGGYVLTSRDITQRKALEDQLRHQALHDQLTGLANRALFLDRTRHALARRSLPDAPLAVLFLDLNDFKTVNDSLGHAAGDDLLREVATRLRGSLRPSDTPARLGGDEFAVLLEDLRDETEATAVANRVLATIKEPFTVRGQEVVVGASIGVAIVDLDRIPRAEDLLRDAEAAMYNAKNSGRSGYACFAPSMHETLLRRIELTAELRHAVDREEFLVHYQPLVELDSGQIAGVEALVRWEHPTRGRVSPVDFIPLTEETGLIVPLGRWVLEQACTQGARWQTPGGPPFEINVNLSVLQIQEPDFIADVARILAASGLPPASLCLEITESFLADESEQAVLRLRELKELGIRLAIDDFGTGYSSLSRLRSFPIDTLKIPKPFVDGILLGSEHSALARAIADLAGTLNLDVVAEGIEQREQWDELRRFGCRFGQGYYFCRPEPAERIDELLRGDGRHVPLLSEPTTQR